MSGPRPGEIEAWAAAQGYLRLVGLDEAGRGPLAGPVVAAAVVLPGPCPIEGLDDSKKLSAARRSALFDEIQHHALAFGVSAAEPPEIDRINILRASLAAMARAWGQVVEQAPALRSALVLVDGRERAPLPADVEQRTFIQGDGRSLHIAAASILAKVTRDRIMRAEAEDHPAYWFESNKGYPGPRHRAALHWLGPSTIHRRSWAFMDGLIWNGVRRFERPEPQGRLFGDDLAPL